MVYKARVLGLVSPWHRNDCKESQKYVNRAEMFKRNPGDKRNSISRSVITQKSSGKGRLKEGIIAKHTQSQQLAK